LGTLVFPGDGCCDLRCLADTLVCLPELLE
jgi:hypothetical protein